ncbi:MAG: hypothetical protein K2H50_04255 [Paramuribaculum sp.]|nr:hypothetical protein [Paramuribaculum sp.]
MRTVLLTLFLVCSVLCSSAQEHLSFKGIPIEGSMHSFCQKLKGKGFTQIGTDGNISLFAGDFTGRNATVGVVAADNGQDVFSVGVLFDESDSWNTLVNTYDYYKDLYVEKYGKPSQCVEKNPSHSDSNTSLMLELFQGRVTYGCLFEVPGGKIQISIEQASFNGGHVMIKYQDSQNVNAKRQSDLDEI